MRATPARGAVVFYALLIAVMVSAFTLVVFPGTARAATYTVTNTNNSGAGSFRQAIEDANVDTNHDTIDFNIPGAGPHTISPTSSLPALIGQVTIDGYSQAGAARATGGTPATIMIELNGTHAASPAGLYFFTNSDHSRVSGLAINRFGNGVYLLNPHGVQIDGNYIGTDTTGTVAHGNAGNGVYFYGNNNTVGGTTAGERNVISGNGGDGVTIVMNDNCVIEGNYIGVDAVGSTALGNGGNGVSLYGNNNAVGGTHAGARNVISGNGGNGIEIGASDGNKVKSSYIGTDASGATAIPNGGHGIDVLGDNATIGGATAGERNVISGSKMQGINIHDSRGGKIKGNYIGTNASGTGRLSNQWSGICLSDKSNNTTIGGAAAGEGNVISGNCVYGVDIQDSTGVKVIGNYIGTNASGTAAICNQYDGVILWNKADNNTIGGAAAGEGNVLSGNYNCGVGINGTKDNAVVGNYIGTDPSGTAAVPNGGGVGLGGASGNTIGGATTGERNIISGNTNDAVNFDNSTGNKVEGNYIGVDKAGTNPLANGGNGVYIHSGSKNSTVGGSGGAGNLIAHNGKDGVGIKDSTGCKVSHNQVLSNKRTGVVVWDKSSYHDRISENTFYGNGALGIDLGGDGVTPNDGNNNNHSKPNRGYNFPVITMSSLAKPGGKVIVTGTAPPNSSVEIYYTGPTPDASGHGQGLTYLDTATAEASGYFSRTVAGVSEGDHLSAIAISPSGDVSGEGNTSEFGEDATVVAPSIAGCEPTSVIKGHTVNVDITGSHTHFQAGESTATFSGNGITVNSTDVTDENHACANITVADYATTGQRDVNVVTAGVTPEPLKGVFTVKEAPPSPPHLDLLSPTSGTVGTHVMLSGDHFGAAQGQSYVTFNGTKVTSYLSWSDATVICPVPSEATTGPVTVTTPAGTSNSIDFTVTKPHIPKITDVSPNAVHQGDSGVDITITGEYTHFEQEVSVTAFSGTGITVNSTTVTDSTHAVANITVDINAPTGSRDVNVVTGGEAPLPLQNHFTVQPHGTLPPRLDGISPGEGAVGDEVTLSGANFGSDKGTSQVTFHQGVPATDYSSWADDKIVCKVPAGATTGPVTVTTSGGTSGGKTFTVVEPVIKDCQPKVVYQGHKVELDVLGEYTHFENGKSVMVVSGDGITVDSTYASDATHASATVTVASDATPGTRDVDVVTGSEHPEPLSNVFTIKKKPDNPPVISGLHPAGGPVGTQVSITGENFGEARGSSTVTFNGTPVTNYVSWSDYDVICNVPLGATTGDVKVQTPWGTSGGAGFTVDDFTFYFAEGTCRPGFAPYLTIQNPDPADADVKITYMLGDGTTQEQDITIPATTRATVTVTDTLGTGDDPAHDFSCKVECTNSQAIVAERPMYFDYGTHQGLSWTGGSDVIGALSPSESFYFAEGTCRPGFAPYLTIQNPVSTEADVKITYMLGDGTTQEQDITVPATTRATVTVTDTLGVGDDSAHDFSCKVECTNSRAIVAERPMYFSYGAPAGLAWTGGSDVVGALSPAEEFYFAEGTCRPGFSPYLTIQNPASTEAQVVITYMRGDGTNQQQALTVPATSRSTVTVADILGSGDSAIYDFSATVSSTNNVDIIAERPMYFNYGGVWTGGSDVVGALSPAGTFYFAEGTCRPRFAPYLTIQNPGLAHAQVKITYMLGDGTTTEQDITVGAQSRYTVFVPDTLGVGDDATHDFSCTVQCTNDKEIIAERPMYFNYNGMWTGGSDVVGFAP